MYCPRCGQHQISEETKFCSRCGFQLGIVSELLANGGFLPQLAELYKGKQKLFTRRNGVIFTVLWFIFFVMMVPAFFGIAGEDDAAGVSAVFGVFTSMMLLILSLAFLKKASTVSPFAQNDLGPASVPSSLAGGVSVPSLPPQQSRPADAYMPPVGAWRAPTTGELQNRVGSVTEGTTKLLKKDDPE